MREKPLIRDQITDELRQQALSLQSNTPVRIPAERELAETLGVSRISLRSAIKSLIAEGLLVQEQGRGTYVTPAQGIRELHVLCSPDIKQNDPFYNEFLVQLTNLAALRSFHLFIIHVEQLPVKKETAPLVIIGSVNKTLLHELTRTYKRIVMLLEDSQMPGVASISFDDAEIGSLAAVKLSEYGHHRVIHLAGPEKYTSARLRRWGFEQQCQRMHLKLTTISAKMNWQGGYQAGEEIAALLQCDAPPTAVFAANDWMAAGMVQRLRELGLSIPEQLSVIGCDDIPLSDQLSPTLTTFRLDMKQMIEQLIAALSQLPAEASDAPIPAPIRLSASYIGRNSLIPNRTHREGLV